MAPRLRPLPEAIHAVVVPGKAPRYRIKNTQITEGAYVQAYTSRKATEFQIPLTPNPDDADMARMVEYHELLHLKHSPDSPEQAMREAIPYIRQHKREMLGAGRFKTPTMLDVMCCEDARIHSLAPKDAPTRSYQYKITLPRGASQLARLCIAGMGTPGGAVAHALLCTLYPKLADAVEELVGRFSKKYERCGPENFVRWTAPLAFHLAKILAPYDYREDQERKSLGNKPNLKDDAAMQARDMGAKVEDGEAGEPLEEVEESGPAKWGRLVWHPAPLTASAPSGARGVRWLPTREGDYLRYPPLLPLGGGFGRRKIRRGLGTTILVDCSGSMRHVITEETLALLLTEAPATLMAGYGGSSRPGNQYGRMVMFAQRGRRVTAQDAHGLFKGYRENKVDLPALEWLAKQRGPRLWISDGNVTDVSVGFMTPAALQECGAIQARAQIVRVESIPEAIYYLKTGRFLTPEER